MRSGRRPLMMAVTALLIFASVLMFASFHKADSVGQPTHSAIYTHGVLRLSIPYHAPRYGEGQLNIEVLDPEDAVVGHVEQKMDLRAGDGVWRQELTLTKPLPVEDLVWHRLRYRFRYANTSEPALEGIESISEILRIPVAHVIGQTSYLAGATAVERVIVTNNKKEPIIGAGVVRVELQTAGGARQFLFDGNLNREGAAEARFVVPANLAGRCVLHFVVDTALGSTDFTQNIDVENKASILLTTEKPIYQPGQTIHVRALALDRMAHEPVAQHKLTFELEDSRGNKVFRKLTQTDEYGVAAAEFSLADEVNLGNYHLRALMQENSAEVVLNVDRYVLPKFKVGVELAQDGAKAKRGYRPGDTVTGTVRANYFFGKPVNSAEITVKATAMDVSLVQVAASEGKTDSDGAYRFDLKLPKYFAGGALTQGAARVLIEATVKDGAGHSETRGEPVIVSDTPILLTAIPESGTLIPGLENQVFVLASYPDGTPAQVEIKANGQSVQSDAGGVAMVAVRSEDGGATLNLTASDHAGQRTSKTISLQSRRGDTQVLLRAERAVFKVGEHMHAKVFSTKQSGAVYVDVIKDGQTVETRDLDLAHGEAEFDLVATPRMAGTVEWNAYVLGEDARTIADHRLIFVQPPDELKIETTVDAPVHKPGEEARVAFRVTNNKGQGVQAALGLQVVDEAVFALAERQPGFAKVFFYLEQEVMKPRYEIHSIGLPEAITSLEPTEARQRDLAARALFAATDLVRRNGYDAEFGRAVEKTKLQEYRSRYAAHFYQQAQGWAYEIADNFDRKSAGGNLNEFLTQWQANHATQLRDAWGHPIEISRYPYGTPQVFSLLSLGPDGQKGTQDDLSTYVRVNQSKPKVRVEHDRGAANGLAQIVGTVCDLSGAAINGATVQVTEKTSGKVQRSRTNESGEFTFAAVKAGRYGMRISAPGFQEASTNVSLEAGDQAVVQVPLNAAGFSQTVGVMAGAVGIAVQDAVIRTGNMPNARFMNLQAMAAPVPSGVLFRAQRSMEQKSPAANPHVRSYFPEALYINPEIITDGDGRASITIPLADNITTWRMAMLASSAHGALGTGSSSLKVFQDFFVDLDLPTTLTQGDQVSLPVAIYNYSGATGNVALQLENDDWFSLVEDTADKTVSVENGKVGARQFTIQANRIGKFKLTLKARLKGKTEREDIVVREIEVAPNGREQSTVFNGRLEAATVEHQIDFPQDSIADAHTIFVRLYPGPLSQVIEGMDSILQMPGGCFEQTSSSTYPNVLALDYMKRTKKLTPEVHAKAEGFIANGYQRLLTFEVPGGGFSWFGHAPANKILTAYGLMEFGDMAKVHELDARVITRTQEWLANQQKADGGWRPDQQFINEGATNRFNTDELRITAYIAWALENTGYQGPAVEKAKQFIEAHLDSKVDPYTLAVIANFAADFGKDRAFMREAMQSLLSAKTEQDDKVWWSAEETGVYGRGQSAAIETTGLAVQALLKSGEGAETVRKAVNFITAGKSAAGAWGTTQATIMALRALLFASEKGGATAKGAVEVLVDGKTAGQVTLTADNNDLLHQFVVKGGNSVQIRFRGQGSIAYQVAGRYFLPWTEKPANEPLSIQVSYDRTHLAQNDIATATATVRNNLHATAKMVMVDLGIPPGFELLSEDLQDYREKSAERKSGRLEKFSLTATQAILYFDSFAAGETVKIPFRLRAKYPIRAKTFASTVYEYYQPEVMGRAAPVKLEVAR